MTERATGTTASGSAVEAIVVGLAGATLGGAVLAPLGLAPIGGVVGGANGAISGRRRIYDWTRPAGVAEFVLDSTWGLAGTAVAVGLHGVQSLRGDGDYRPDLSERRGYHVYAGGVRLKPGFAVTWGNVISNAAGRTGLDPGTETGRRRRRFVRDHEGLHVRQNRVFGPLYPILYAGWMVPAAIVGLMVGLVRRRDLYRTVETLAYYDNPFEVMAYRADGKWPPSGALPGLTWPMSPPRHPE